MNDRLQADLKTAMVARDKLRVNVIQSLKTALKNEAINNGELNSDQEIAVLRREAKKRQEAATMYQEAGRSEQAEIEEQEQAIIEAYLPAQLTEAQLVDKVQAKLSEMGNVGQQDMGRVMGELTRDLKGTADNAVLARIVRDLLEKKNQ